MSEGARFAVLLVALAALGYIVYMQTIRLADVEAVLDMHATELRRQMSASSSSGSSPEPAPAPPKPPRPRGRPRKQTSS